MLLYQIGLTLLPGVGDITARKLVGYCGDAEAVFREKKRNLLRIPGISEAVAEGILSKDVLPRAEKEIKFTEKYGVQPLFYLDPAYPRRLNQCTDSPVLLYFKGEGDLNAPRVVSIVGTRNATDYGKETCSKLVEVLGGYGILVVSGLAYGIDTAAHKAALNNKLSTVGVMAHGLDRIYPHLNRPLAEKMIGQGGLLTEFMTGTQPDRENFPRRNRIIAGMADATIVVESGIKGGALITANIANSYNRDVFAIPGKVTDSFSEGCNFLIKTNRAALVTEAIDILYMMGWENNKTAPGHIQRQLFINMTPEEEVLCKLLENGDPFSLDYLVIHSGLSASKVASALLSLEFQGIVKTLPGKIFKMT